MFRMLPFFGLLGFVFRLDLFELSVELISANDPFLHEEPGKGVHLDEAVGLIPSSSTRE